VTAASLTPRAVAREFESLLDAGAEIKPAGEARNDPGALLEEGYVPRLKIELFGTRFFLTRARKNPAVRFFVAYVVPPSGDRAPRRIYPRIFYKDLSLVWRVGSHLVATDDEFWIGKGAVERWNRNGYEHLRSVESTTDLPLEMQTALEAASHGQRRLRIDERALFLVLRNSPQGRVEPYRDFTIPRDRATERPEGRIHGGKRVAWFSRKNDPMSLRFARGFAPDFERGIVEQSRSSSRLYGGRLHRFRILSENRRIQYLFFAGPRHSWIVPPQAMTTELSSYGVRVVDVRADEDLFVPGFEYHYMDDDRDPPERVSQIPEGFAGAQADFDPTRADASAWLDGLPVLREFRTRVLKKGVGPGPTPDRFTSR
jgi:hypothetical protein